MAIYLFKYFQTYSFLSVTLGSPVYNCLLRILGVKIDGRALLFPSRIYEFSMIAFSDKAIVDSDHITGHYAVYGNITIGPCRVGGVSCGRNYVANALSTNIESGPMRAFVGTHPISGKEISHKMSATYRNITNDHEEQVKQEHFIAHPCDKISERRPMRAFVGTYPSSDKENRDKMSSTYCNQIVNDCEEQGQQEHFEEHV